MTQQEKQEIIEAVLEALQTNSQSISQLTPVTELVDSDLFEVAGGKRVTFANIVASLLSSSGYAAATAAEQAEMWQVLMANFVATQGNESVGGVQPPLTHWSQSRVVLLKSMGAPFDDVEASTLSVGDLIYSSQGKWIFEKLENNLGNGIHPSEGVLYVNLAAFKAYRWDGTSFQDAIKGGNGASSVTAFAQYSVVESTSELPSVGDPNTGYIVGTHIYVYVGEDGDTADGKYQDLGELNAAGLSVTTNGDGTFTIHAGGNDYTVNLNHTHPNMCKLVVCEESGLPSTLDNSTIYAITDSGETEIEKLIICGMEFAGGVPDTGMPMVAKPNTLRPLNLGNNTGSGVTALVDVKARNLNYNGSTDGLTVSVGQNSGLLLSYDQTVDATSITIPQLAAETGCQITVKYTGSGALNDGALVFSHDNAVLASVVVVVVVAPVQVAGVKLTGTQWLETDYHINANTKITLRGTFAANSVTDSTNDYYYMSCDSYNNQGRPMLYVGKKDSTTYNFCAAFGGNPAIQAVAKNVMVTPDSTIEIYGSTVKFTPNGGSAITLTVPNSLGSYENPLKIGHYLSKDGTNSSIFKSFDLTIHELTISENNVTKRHYIPATLGGVPGLHDTETGAFISSMVEGEPLVVVQS